MKFYFLQHTRPNEQIYISISRGSHVIVFLKDSNHSFKFSKSIAKLQGNKLNGAKLHVDLLDKDSKNHYGHAN
jgi:hypothetical protein